MNDNKNLKQELDHKIHNIFKDHQAYLDYLLQTKQNFLHRYLETSTDKNLQIQNLDEKTLAAISHEENLGEAFKISAAEIKAGITRLAKSVPREEKPCVQYSLKSIFEDLRGDYGKIIIESKVSWGFPEFKEEVGSYKKKRVLFEYHDPNIFRKELALKFEEACELFS